MRQIIALDFDGVICDSIDECMLVSYFAYNGGLKIPSIDISVIKPDLQDSFREFRYLVGPAKDFYFLWRSLLNSSIPGDIIKKYYQLQISKAGMELPFVDRFYYLRTKLKENYFKKWVSFNPIYKQMKEFLTHSTDINDLYIVTAKDAESVFELLLANSIMINRKQIYGREISLDKVELFRKIVREARINPQNILYIEDRISHLIDVQVLSIKTYLATWGYNSPSARKKALLNNITPISLNDIFSITKDGKDN